MTTQRLFAITAVLVLLLAYARPAAAQQQRRWIADPMLLTSPKMIGPSGNVRVADGITDISLVQTNETKGWATRASGIWKLENNLWQREQSASSTTFYTAVSMVGETYGWVVGSETVRVPPYSSQALMLRYDGAQWQGDGQVTHTDGSTSVIDGFLTDVATISGGAAWAVGGSTSEIVNQPRPLALYFDGAHWYDRTPAEWRYGALTSLHMFDKDNGWAAGVLGRPGGDGANAVRPTILRLSNGVWSEEPLPSLPIGNQPFTVRNLVMSDVDQGWAIVYDAGAECGFGYLLRRVQGAWSLVAPSELGSASVTALGLVSGTNHGWVSLGGCQARGQHIAARRAHFDNGRIDLDLSGTQFVPDVYALLSDDQQWAAAGASMLRYSDAALPTERVGGAGAGAQFFPETGHTIAGEFRSYYATHGLQLGDRGITPRESLALFGYPISQPFEETNAEDGKRYLVQYFERARFELHTENQAPYRVLLGRVGFLALLDPARNSMVPVLPNPDPAPVAPGCVQFPEVRYDVCPPFLDFWRRSGGLPVFGFPMNRAQQATNLADSNMYLTQQFERERLEYHPEHRGTPYEVQLGLLGAEALRLRGYMP